MAADPAEDAVARADPNRAGAGPAGPVPDDVAGPDRPPAGLDRPFEHRHRPLRTALTGVGLALLAAVGVAAAFFGVGPAAVDRAVLGESIQVRSGGLTTVATAITTIGSTAMMGLLAVLVGFWLLRRGRGVDAVFVVGTMAGASLAFTGVKRLLDRPRPPLVDQLVAVSNESLPSGHATMAVAVLGSLVVLAWHGRRTAARVAMVVAVVLWAGMVGLTRIYLGVHWFSDVLAGWLVGGAWLALCSACWSLYRSRSAAARSSV
jgi:membrane-associated phospholipid phosphatase